MRASEGEVTGISWDDQGVGYRDLGVLAVGDFGSGFGVKLSGSTGLWVGSGSSSNLKTHIHLYIYIYTYIYIYIYIYIYMYI